MNMPVTQNLYPKEPTRFEPRHIEDLLVYCHSIEASDVTIQTESPIYAEIYGKLVRITKRRLSNTEVEIGRAHV